MMLLIFVAGLVAGSLMAFLIFSLCVISGRSEDRMIEGLRDMKQQEMIAKVDKVLRHWPEIDKGVLDYHAQEGRSAKEMESLTCRDGYTVPHPEKWLQAIWASYSSSDELRRTLVDRRYKACERYIKTSMALNISERSYYALLDDFRMSTALAAVQLGLLRIL